MSSFSDKMNQIDLQREQELQKKREETRRQELELPKKIIDLMKNMVQESLERELKMHGYGPDGNISSTVVMDSYFKIDDFKEYSNGRTLGYSSKVEKFGFACEVWYNDKDKESVNIRHIYESREPSSIVHFYTAGLDCKKSIINKKITEFIVSLSISEESMKIINSLKRELLEDGINSSFYFRTYFDPHICGETKETQSVKDFLESKTYRMNIKNVSYNTNVNSSIHAELIIESVFKRQ